MATEKTNGFVEYITRYADSIKALFNTEDKTNDSFAIQNTAVESGDVLTLLSGQAYIHMLKGFPTVLDLDKPLNIDGISPILTTSTQETLIEQIVEEALAKGIDPVPFLESLEATAAGAGEEIVLGEGGGIFLLDPNFALGSVTAGYPTGPVTVSFDQNIEEAFLFEPVEEVVTAPEEPVVPEPLIPPTLTGTAQLLVHEDAIPGIGNLESGQRDTHTVSLASLFTNSPNVSVTGYTWNSDLSSLDGILTSNGNPVSFTSSDNVLTGSTPNGAIVIQYTIEGFNITKQIFLAIEHPTPDGDDSETFNFDLSEAMIANFSDGTSRVLSPGTVTSGIEDDVPIAIINLTNNTLTIDETVDAQNDDTIDPGVAGLFANVLNQATDNNLPQFAQSKDITGNAAPVVDINASKFGADEEGATKVLSLSIQGGDNTDSLLETTDGKPILLVKEGNLIVGRVDSNGDGTVDTGEVAAFAIAIDASTGIVSVAQYLSLLHPVAGDNSLGEYDDQVDLSGLINAVVTVTDGDQDFDIKTVGIGDKINFDDDGPTASTLSLTVDEDDLPAGNNDIQPGDDLPINSSVSVTNTLTHDFGSDDEGASIDFASMHGQTVTVGNDEVTYNWDAGTNTLTAYRTALGVDNVFQVSVNTNTWEYTFTLLSAINHHQTADNTEELNATVNLTYTVRDGDGDVANGTLNVIIDDDIPVAIDPEAVSLSNTAGANAIGVLDSDENIDDNVGADQPGTISFFNITDGMQAVGTIDGESVDLTSNNQNIFLYLVDHDSDPTTPDVLEGWINGTPEQEDQGASRVFRITLNPDGDLNLSNDTYTFHLDAPIGVTTTTELGELGFARAGNNIFNSIDVPGTDQDLLFSAYNRSLNGNTTVATVNNSNGRIGVSNQSMEDGENLRIDFVNKAAGLPITDKSGPNEFYDYNGHYTINNFSFSIVQINGNLPPNQVEMWVRAYDADDDDPIGTNTAQHSAELSDDPQIQITGIKVTHQDGTFDILDVNLLQSDGSGGYLIRDLSLNDRITVTTDNGYDRIEVENALSGTHGVIDPTLNGESFDIGFFSFETTVTNIPEVNLEFDLSLTDADGDTVVIPGAIQVALTEPAETAAPIVLDLENNGFTFLAHDDPANQIVFDYKGDGRVQQTAWLGAMEAFLVFDINSDQIVNSGLELTFSDPENGAYTDLEGLRMNYDTNADGVLDGNDANFAQFGLWHDANVNGISEDGEFINLEDYGITSFDLSGYGDSYTDANGEVTVHSLGEFNYTDGSTGTFADVSLSVFDADVLEIPDDMTALAQYAGGDGFDIVKFNEMGMGLNADEIKEHFAGGFEQIDMRENGDNTLSLDFDAVISMSDGSELNLQLIDNGSVNVLKVVADAGDMVSLENAKDVTAQVANGQLGEGDHVYQLANPDATAMAYVQIVGAPIVQADQAMTPPPADVV